MKYQFLNYLVLISSLLLSSCTKEEISPAASLFFNVETETIYPDDFAGDYISKVVESKITKKTSSWVARSGFISLSREIELEVKLENGEILNVNFAFNNREVDKDILILESENSLSETSHTTRFWRYKNKIDEINNFYNESLKAYLTMNNTFTTFNQETESFNIAKAKIVKIDGFSKIYCQIQFKAYTYGYSPTRFNLKGGLLSAVIE